MTQQSRRQNCSERVSLYELIVENSGDVLWAYDFLSDHYTYASPSVLLLRGYTQDEVIQQRLYDALTPQSAEKAKMLVGQRINALESGDMTARFGVDEFEQIRKDGSTVMTEVMTTFVTNKDNQVTGIVGIARDISKRLEDQQLRQELEKKLYENQKHESINRIVGGVAHTLNNALTPVSGWSELLGEIFQDNDEAVGYCQQIYQSTLKATGLIDQLLDYTGAHPLILKEVELSQAIVGFEQLLRSAIKENILINLRHDGSCPRVRMDLDKLRQIIINLAFNSQDAMPEGGELSLTICTVQLDKKLANQFEVLEGNYAQILVTDTGTGIEPSVLPKIFEPFFTTKDFGMASGLGLSAIHGIVKQHNGAIKLTSNVGKGTSVIILLPIHDNEFDGSRNQVVDSGSNGIAQKTILLVEDDENIRILIQQLIRRKEYTVLLTGSPLQALEMAMQHSGDIDLLITDVVMPEMNGKQLAEALQSRFPSIQTLFISGYSNNIIKQIVQLPPKCHFIQKPFSLKDLNRIIQQLLAQ
ncbi:MAG: response regulator [Chlorobiaceae bacterium]|nr:response regulator [Chlorobiaceae bacterium]